MAEAEALGTTEADMIAVRLSAQEVEMKAAEASVAPLVQGPPSLRESTREAECGAELGSEASRAAEATRVEAQRLKEKAEASRVEAQHWKETTEASRVEARRWEQKAKESEAEVTRAAEASVAV
ncbi:uncharacterized protein [Miscanthus floridulus]|uniref:uncharacterized protein n=1 Tax=Miscanthus floridulus TaxID=154761 RepID=UPI003457CA16